MSTQTHTTLFGLAASGLFWLATPVALGQGGPAPKAPTSSPASPGSPSFSVLLLTNGKVVRGKITREPSGVSYVLKQGGVPIAYPAMMVEKAGGSIEELYQFRVSRLAERDPDERMKLARWCLTEGLPDRAKEQLAAILAMCPGDREATRMQYSMAAADERAASVDVEVRRTNGDMPDTAGAPAPLPPEALKRLRQDYGKDVIPVIFDLPPAQAVGRAREFTQKVHPILQNRCASCHNEKYAGAFQLVVAKGRRDMNSDVARANLDATLRLVNPEDAARSELLSAGLVPHGNSKNAIFRGPNELDYRILDTWVRALRPAPGASNSVARTGYQVPGSTPSSDGFATDRANRPATSGSILTPVVPIPDSGGFPPLPGNTVVPTPILPPNASKAIVDTQHLSADYSGGVPDSAFQVPFSAGGELPDAVKAARKQANAGRTPTSPQDPARRIAAAQPGMPPLPPSGDVREVQAASGDAPGKLLGMDQPLYPPSSAATSAKKKAAGVDPKLLEQMIKQRNGTP